jgi:phenylpyruvate tautomerase PptA (4-oxalocrotonate tautomerase family)
MYDTLYTTNEKNSGQHMPILDIELVASDTTESLPADLTQSLADAAAQVFGSPQGGVWVKVHVVPSTQYAENGGLPEGVQPVFVMVLKSRVPEGSALKDEITQLTQGIAKVLNRPDSNIHIFYQPDGAGRVSFGGKLVE